MGEAKFSPAAWDRWLKALKEDDVDTVETLMQDDNTIVEQRVGISETSALHIAAAAGSRAVCKHLLASRVSLRERLALIEARNKLGNGPLHLACRNGHEAVARLLLDAGANPCCKNSLYQSPWDFAATEQIKNLLVEKVVENSVRDADQAVKVEDNEKASSPDDSDVEVVEDEEHEARSPNLRDMEMVESEEEKENSDSSDVNVENVEEDVEAGSLDGSEVEVVENEEKEARSPALSDMEMGESEEEKEDLEPKDVNVETVDEDVEVEGNSYSSEPPAGEEEYQLPAQGEEQAGEDEDELEEEEVPQVVQASIPRLLARAVLNAIAFYALLFIVVQISSVAPLIAKTYSDSLLDNCTMAHFTPGNKLFEQPCQAENGADLYQDLETYIRKGNVTLVSEKPEFVYLRDNDTLYKVHDTYERVKIASVRQAIIARAELADKDDLLQRRANKHSRIIDILLEGARVQQQEHAARLAEQAAKLATATRSLAAKDSKIASLKEDLDSHRAMHAQYDMQAKQTEQIWELNGKLANATRATAERDAKIEELNGKLAEKAEEAKECEADALKKKSELARAVAAQKVTILQMQGEKASIRFDYQAQLAGRDFQIKELTGKLAKAEQRSAPLLRFLADCLFLYAQYFSYTLTCLLLLYVLISSFSARFPRNHNPIRSVVLKRQDEGYGIMLSGAIVKEILPCGSAGLQGGLQIGDEIVGVNDVNVETLKPSVIAEKIRASGEQVRLWVRKNPGRA